MPALVVWDRPALHLATSLSCLGHALVIGLCVWPGVRSAAPMRRAAASATPFKLVYADDAIHAQARHAVQAAQRLLTGRIVIPGPSELARRVPSGETGWDRIADRVMGGGISGGAGGAVSPGASFGQGAGGLIDLTDVTAAAHGDPVRLAYFSAIRAQVQGTADTQDWVSGQASSGGLVYVQFAITRTGRIHAAAMLPDRSQAAPMLCDAAVRLVAASSPFLPFPPSFEEASLTVLLPIEFLAH